MFTPNGSAVPARTAVISAAIAAGALYPAARKPRAPARAAATTSSAVDGPPAMGATTTRLGSRSVSPRRALVVEGCVIGIEPTGDGPGTGAGRGPAGRAGRVRRSPPRAATRVPPGPGTSPGTGPPAPAWPRP